MLRERRDRIRDPDRAPCHVGMQPFTDSASARPTETGAK